MEGSVASADRCACSKDLGEPASGTKRDMIVLVELVTDIRAFALGLVLLVLPR